MAKALSRWKHFFASFDHIDAAIEAAEPSVTRDEVRRMRLKIIDLFCAAAAEDYEAEEGISLILDKVMAESLVTLQSVPADVVPKLLASCADLAKAVGALRGHASERVRGLARDIIREWKTCVEGDIATMNAAMAKLDALSQLTPLESTASHASDVDRNDNNPKTKKDPLRKMAGASGQTKIAPAAGTSRATITHEKAPLKLSEAMMPKKERRTAYGSTASNVTDGQSDNLPLKHQAKFQQENRPLTKKRTPVVVSSDRAKVSEASPLPKKTVLSPEEMMESTKRKLHAGYQEVADAKRQRKIQVIQAPKMPEHKQSKTHAILRERRRQRLGNSTAVRLSLLPSFHRDRV